MRINDPTERDALITKMMNKYSMGPFSTWMIWFMQKDGYSITADEIANKLGRGLGSIYNDLSILRKNGDIKTSSVREKTSSVDEIPDSDPIQKPHEPMRKTSSTDDFIYIYQEDLEPVPDSDPIQKEESIESLVAETRSSDYLQKLQLLARYGKSEKFAGDLLAYLKKWGKLKPKQIKTLNECWSELKTMLSAEAVTLTREPRNMNWLPPESPAVKIIHDTPEPVLASEDDLFNKIMESTNE